MFALMVAAVTPAHGDADKSQYHLFHPTPRHLMREMSTDRPDTTESPISVDAGHIQLESSFLEYTRDRRQDSFDVIPTNLKLGLTNAADIQFVLQPYFASDGPDGEFGGLGDSQIRLKVNLWGNDGGDTALAVMPFVQLPSGENDVGAGKVEGGLIIPLSIELPRQFNLTVMAEFDVVRNLNDGYRLDFVHTATINREIAGPLGGFLEYVGVMRFEDDADYLASIASGITYAVSPDVQLDAALQAGLADQAEDFQFRTGVSFRF